MALMLLAGCLERRDSAPVPYAECAACHGSASREGDGLRQAAPPIDLGGNTDPRYPGVGAHDRHLTGSDTHAPVACSECHQVPDSVKSPGHADSALPAELTFGELARTTWTGSEGAAPGYDFGKHSCGGTYCHRDYQPVWITQKPEAETCGTCHGLPPAAPHPQDDQCHRCHSQVIDKDRKLLDPARHVDGVVDVGKGLVPGDKCHACHGSKEASPAPPPDLSGATDRASLGVGAHEAHLAGGANSRPVDCGDCHQVPESVDDAGHLDPAPAELTFAGPAVSHGREPVWDREAASCTKSWCHGPSTPDWPPSPEWTGMEGPLGCNRCHGQGNGSTAMPPPPPHPQMFDCERCHFEVVAAGPVIVARDKHVDGTVQVVLPTACDGCHGTGPTGAPPPDLGGNMTSAAVGAHATHLAGGPNMTRPVACNECHVVPMSVTDPGHFDSALPAELTFSGVATAFNATPSYEGGKCANTYCHGGMFPGGHPSGGLLTEPAWAAAEKQAYCGSCHGLPPPPPHPVTGSSPCANCHPTIDANFQFPNPALHVDGNVDLKPNP